MRWAMALLLALSGCSCRLPGASTPETRVELSEEVFNEYWRQLERRWPAYFTNLCRPVPVLPESTVIRARVHFLEVPHERLATCTYRKRTNEIRIGDDKWQSGCVPHELGHAVCDYLRQPPGCDTFEHSDARSRC